MSGGGVVACPRCGSCDPLDTQVQTDYWRGFKFCVMACVCGYGEAAPYCGDFENVSARFYRKEATDLAAAIARAEAAEARGVMLTMGLRAAVTALAHASESDAIYTRTYEHASNALRDYAIDRAAIAAQQAEGVA